MYHPDNSPVGLYVEEGRELVRANTSAGPGNFHMRPNGVFYVTGKVAGVLETRSFIKQKPQVDFATQSGAGRARRTNTMPHMTRIVLQPQEYSRRPAPSRRKA
jgi:uncharacterized protein YigE (DUF2233 family)